MKKEIKLLILAFAMLASVFLVTSCSDTVETIYLLKDKVTDYAIVYSKDDIGHYEKASEIFTDIIIDYGAETPPRYEYTDGQNDKEIVIGDTDRQISKDLKAAIAEKANGAGGVWWAYGYKDGKLGFYANSEAAMKFGWSTFYDLIMKDNTIECQSNLWVVDGMTQAEYDEYLQDIQDEIDAEQEAIRQQKIAVLREKIAAIGLNLLTDEMPSFVNSAGNPTYGTTTIGADLLYSHPRIWVNSDTLPDVIANLHVNENAKMYERMYAMADLEYTGMLNPQLNFGTTEYPNLRNFDSVTDCAKIEALAFMYLVTGDEIYGYTAIRAAKNFLNTVRVLPDKATWNSSEIYNISNQCSTAMGIIAEVYDWCYPLLHETDKEFLIKGTVTKLASCLEVDYPPKNTGCVTGHSTSALILRDWLSFAIAVADENPEIYNYIMGLTENYYAPAPNWYYPSGANFQGSAYGINKTYLHIVSEMLVMLASGEKLYADDVSFEAVINTYISNLRPDDESLRLGDDYHQYNKYHYVPDARVEIFGCFYYKNPVVKAWAMYRTNNFNEVEYEVGLLELTPLRILLLNDPNLEYDDSTRNEMPLVNYNGSPYGAITARSAWGDPHAWMVHTKIGEAYGANHEHKEAGTFHLYYNGILAPNTGAYQYYGTELGQRYGSAYDLAYVKQTVSKNGLLIYNPKYDTGDATSGWIYSGGQTTQSIANSENATLDVWLSKLTSHQAKELGHAWSYDENGELEYAYISGDITNAYDSDTVDLVMRSTIAIATGDEDHPLVFIVYDRITSDSASFTKSYLLHTMEAPTFVDYDGTQPSAGITNVSGTNVFYYTNLKGAAGTEDTSDDLDKYNGKLTHTTLLPENPTFTVIGGDGYRFWVDGMNRGQESKPEAKPYAEIGWGRVEISPSVTNKTDSFLNVMYVGDAKDENGNLINDPYISSVLVQSDTHEGAISFGNCVMFSKSNEPITGKVSFTTDGNGEMTYYVTGLSAGKWNISVNGSKINSLYIDEESGVATFKAPAGQIELDPQFAVLEYELNGGKLADGVKIPIVANLGENTTIPTDITIYGSRFDGWYTSADFSGSPVTELNPDTKGTITLYAKWTKVFGVIKYETYGGEIIGEYTDQKYPGTKIVLPTEVVRDEDIFRGWYTDSKFTNPITEIPEDSIEDITVYAKYKVMGAFWSTGPKAVSSGYWFGSAAGGWDGGDIGTAMIGSESTMLTLRIDLATVGNSNWIGGSIRMRQGLGGSECHFIRFENGNMLTGNNKTVLAKENDDVVIDVVVDFVAQDITYYVDGNKKAVEHYTSIGTDLTYYNFQTSPEEGKDLARGNLFQVTGVTGGITRMLAYDGVTIYISDLYEDDTRFASINYELGDGQFVEGANVPYIATVGEKLTLPTADSMLLYGSRFDGWYTSADFSGSPVTEITAASSDSVTLYAKWTKAFGVITYELDGGEIVGDYTDSNAAGTKVILPTQVVRDDDRFLGWYTDPLFTDPITELAEDSSEDITVYAKYKVMGPFWSTGSAAVDNAYWFGASKGGWEGGDIGTAMIGSESTKLTLSIDLAAEGSSNWVGGSVRMRQGLGGSDCHLIRFENGNMVTGNNKTVLAKENDDVVIDVVVDFVAQDITYYVDGNKKAVEHYTSIGTDLTYYNFETSPEDGTALSRGNLFQLTAVKDMTRTVAYDGVTIYISDIYSE